MLRLKVARTVAEIERLSGVWDSLLSPDLTLFQSYRWNHLAAQVFGDREAPHFLYCEDDNGRAIIPAVLDLAAKSIGFAGECLFDYRDYLAQGDLQPLRHAWRELAKLKSPLKVTAIRRPRAEGWGALPKTSYSRAPRLSTAGITPEQFTHMHSRAFSRLRRLQRMGLMIEQHCGDAAVVRRIYEARARQSSAAELFCDSKRVEFMAAICALEGSRCEVFTLAHGSTLAAAVVTFRDGEYRRFYTTYYDHAWARYSPGISLLFEIARRSLEQGLTFDFMTGEQSYKMRIAQQAEDLFQVNASADDLGQAFSRRKSADRAA